MTNNYSINSSLLGQYFKLKKNKSGNKVTISDQQIKRDQDFDLQPANKNLELSGTTIQAGGKINISGKNVTISGSSISADSIEIAADQSQINNIKVKANNLITSENVASSIGDDNQLDVAQHLIKDKE